MSKSYALRSILAVVLVLGLESCVTVRLFVTPAVSPTPIGPRQIVENTLGLHEYWRIHHPCISAPSPGLVAAPGRVTCLYYESSNKERIAIQVLDAARGSVLWEALGKPSSGLEKVFMDNKRLYLKTVYEVQAYDLDDGQQLWDRSISIKGGLLYSDGRELDILSGGGEPWKLYTLDAHTGDTLNSESLPTKDDFVLFAQYPQFDLYFGLIPGSAQVPLRAIDRTTQQVRWQVKGNDILSLPNWPPVLLDDVLLIDTGEKVIALDAQSGQVLWKQGGGTGSIDSLFATRTMLMNGSLYALRFDGRLLRFDPKTGKETGHIQFAPGLPTSSPRDKFFSLATDGRMLFVSFDDSQELVALGP